MDGQLLLMWLVLTSGPARGPLSGTCPGAPVLISQAPSAPSTDSVSIRTGSDVRPAMVQHNYTWFKKLGLGLA